jgi:hypothetical protein
MADLIMLPLKKVRTDGDTNPRCALDVNVANDYSEDMRRGDVFPPVVVFHDGVHHWLACGFHRYHAHKILRRSHIEADVRPGTRDDARLFAASTNADHGLRRSVLDRRRAVCLCLLHPVAGQWSPEQVARHAHVSEPLVRSIISAPAVVPAAARLEEEGEAQAQAESEEATRPEAKATASPESEWLTDEDRQRLLGQVERLLRKLDRAALTLGTTAEQLLADWRRQEQRKGQERAAAESRKPKRAAPLKPFNPFTDELPKAQ